LGVQLTRTKNLIGAALAAAAIAAAGLAYGFKDHAKAAGDPVSAVSHPNATPGPHGSHPPGYTFAAARD
jgi:hypothetical protein